MTAPRPWSSVLPSLPSFRLSVLPSFRPSVSPPYLSPLHVPTAHPQVPPPRLRVLGPGLAAWGSGSRSCTATTSRRSSRGSGGSTGPGCCSGWGWRRWTGSAAGSGTGSSRGTCIPNPSLKGMILAGGMGAWAGLHHAAQLGRRADDDVHHAALRRAAAGGGHLDLHELRRDRPVLRHRGAAGAAVRRRAVAGPAGQRARPLAVRSVPGEPDHHRRHRRADGDRALLPEDGARPDPPVRGVGRTAEPAGGRAAGAAQGGHRRGPRERDRLQQSGRLARAASGRRCSRRRRTPTSCSPATSPSAPSVSTPTSSTSS